MLLAHIETFVERALSPDAGHGLPRFVERELRRYLECGLLARRVTRYLERQGRLPRAHAPVDAD
ncbi:MAG: hypothetical protein FJ299_10335 [Planctomycetes bacterium]|nr:hypothetical protein [Planctomycetota bacterium]